MDFKIQSSITGDANKMYLWDHISNSLLKLNLITNTYQISFPLPITDINNNAGFYTKCSFLAWHPSSTVNLELYGEGEKIHVWNKSLNNLTSTINSSCFAIIGGQSSVGPLYPLAITDSGN